jgi:hypothetical protein
MFDGRLRTDTDTEPLVLRADDLPEPGSPGLAQMWRRLAATLVYDSRLQPLTTGVRSPMARLPRLMFTARGMEIDLQIRPSKTAGRIRMLGHVLDEDFEPCTGSVVIESVHGSIGAELDNCGHFTIDGLTPGRHRIEVHLPLALISVPPIHM